MTDYFEVFGLPRKLSLDLQELQRRFYDLSRLHHPDFHQTADALAQAASLTRNDIDRLAVSEPVDPVVVVVDLRGFEERGPDEDVVALATPGGVPVGLGAAMAIPPPTDRAPTIRSAPAPARAWLVRLRWSISNASPPRGSGVSRR